MCSTSDMCLFTCTYVLAALVRSTLCCYSYGIIRYTVYFFFNLHLLYCTIVLQSIDALWYIIGCCIHQSGGYNVLHDKLNADGEGAVNLR